MVLAFVLSAALVPQVVSQQAAQSAVAAQTGRLSGQVIEDGTSEPVGDARVILQPSTPGPLPGVPPQMFAVSTDREGRFAFDAVAPGTYRIQVQKGGFYANPESTTPPMVRVSAGEQRTLAALSLRRGGVIAGRVVGPSGQPLVEARVRAIATVSQLPGGGSSGMGGSSQTNDLGEFRLYGLVPGAYYVQVSPPVDMGTLSSSNAATVMTNTYHPDAIDRVDAAVVSVAAGRTASNVEVRMAEARAYRITGTVVDEVGKPIEGAMVFANSDPMAGGTRMEAPRRTSSDAAGRFVLTGVTAGSYLITATVPVSSGPGGTVGATSGMVFGTMTTVQGVSPPPTPANQARVAVGSEPVENVRLVIRKPTPP